jgi:hypothetical protein
MTAFNNATAAGVVTAAPMRIRLALPTVNASLIRPETSTLTRLSTKNCRLEREAS